MRRLLCFGCQQPVSTLVPDETVVSATISCVACTRTAAQERAAKARRSHQIHVWLNVAAAASFALAAVTAPSLPRALLVVLALAAAWLAYCHQCALRGWP